MNDLFDTLQKRYQVLVVRKEGGETDEPFLEDVRVFIADAQRAGATVADVGKRSQLRAWMRFLAGALYDATGTYPDTSLQPLAHGQLVSPQVERQEKPPSSFLLAWVLVGGAAAIIIVVGLIIIVWASSPESSATPVPEPTSTPMPFVSHVEVGTELSEGGTLEMVADTFCLNTPEIIGEFAMEGIEPETVWNWEVKRDGDVVAAQTAAPWGKEIQHVTIHALTGGPEGVEPGQYELLIYVGDQVVGVQSFQVLDTAPRVSNLQVSDVPELVEQAPERNEFEAGLRVIYPSYDYEGLCPGLTVSHVLYYEGELLQEIVDTWSGAPQGQAQVSFQAPEDSQFSAGDYEAAVAIAGEEQERVGFTIRDARGDMGALPAFGDITIALGVEPDGTPILPVPDGRLDWNTKIVYAIFDYVGMSDGLTWTAVWSRNGQTLAQQEEFWNVETDGTEGTRWVTHHDANGRVLPSGAYSVTLYIGSITQQTAGFDVRYVPQQ